MPIQQDYLTYWLTDKLNYGNKQTKLMERDWNWWREIKQMVLITVK